MKEDTEILALIKLLDDDDPVVFEHVSNKLISYGPDIIPRLEHAWEDTFNPHIHERIEELIHYINFETLLGQFKAWGKTRAPDLYDGAILVAKYHFPDLNEDEVRANLDQIKQKIWLELHNNLTPLEQVNVFNHIFYGIVGFNGSYSNKPETKDYCINQVLESKNGNTISLGIIYLILAQELDLSIYGVRLHRHFILSFQKKFIQDFTGDHIPDSIFYINAMNKGMIFPRNEIKDYLKNLGEEESTTYFKPASEKEVVDELLKYLQYHFQENGDDTKSQEIEKIRNIIS